MPAPLMSCLIDGCEKGGRRKRGMCEMHYQRWRIHGDATRGRIIEPLCIRCGAEKHRNESGKLYCKSCAAATNAQYQARERDRLRADKRVYHVANRERDNARSRQRYEANRDAHNAQVREWQLANVERKRQYARTWYARNKAKAHGNVAVRRARMLKAICEHGRGCVTGALLKAVKTQACVYCGVPAEHADHRVPITRGGLHCRENIVPACRHCNQSKNNRLLDEWKRAV